MSEDGYTMEEIQHAMAEMESLEENIGAMMEQERMTSMVVEDYIASVEALRNMSEEVGDREMLVPLGGNVMIKARLVSEENVLVGIGSGISVEKSPSEALEIVEKKKEELEKGLENLRNRLRDMDMRRQELAAFAQKAYASLQSQSTARGAQ